MARREKRKNRKNREQGVTKHPNRGESRANRGNKDLMEERRINNENYQLDWFVPTETQKEIKRSIYENPLTAVQGSSGCGKSTTVIHEGLRLLSSGQYKKILFIKSPTEDGDDQIGFLSGNESEKLSVHMEAMRSIFYDFMTKEKLAMEEKKERIKFSIPNFEAGKTFYDSFIILDESQKFSPSTMKLLLERVHESSKVVILGDKAQRYAAKKRKDGFTDFVEMITDVDDEGRYSIEDLMGYVEMTAADNMRGALSQRIVTLYEERD